MKYSLGLDIGITSVGWAVLNLDKNRIEDLGVRAFNAAEVPKTRESLAKPRREAKSARRRLGRRRGRLNRAKAMFVEYGLLMPGELDRVFPEHPKKDTPAPDPWRLRAEGLDCLLSGEEFSRALYHIAKRRGFKSNRKGDRLTDDEKKKETKKMLAGVDGMRGMLSERNYRTVGEMIYCHEDFQDRKRNRDRDYSHTVERVMLEDEIRILFETQRRRGSKLASSEFEREFLPEAFNWQKPFASGEDILKKVGLCTFEGKNGERRAPRAAWTAERFNLLCNINNLQIVLNGDRQPLTCDQRRTVEEMAYESPKVTYKQIRKKLGMHEDARFAGSPLNYRKPKKGKVVDELDCENSAFYLLSAYHTLRKALSATELWDMVKDSPDLMDDLAFALTFYKNNDDIRAWLTDHHVPSPLLEALTGDDAPSFNGVGNMSIKAMRNIIPHLEQGLKYHAACAAAGYSHYDPKGEQERGLKLPVIDRDHITNPVVLRALAQARKVVNHIVARHGTPTYVNIELARDIGKSAKKRDEIKSFIEENTRARQEDDAHFKECFGSDPKGEHRIKWRLWREQNGQCPYSQKRMDIEQLLAPGYVAIDHILPHSRSFDSRISNRVLVHWKENCDKGDRTPYEYLMGNPERWTAFQEWVKATIRDRDKRANLLTETFAARQEEWMQRSLSDTRYAATFFAEFLQHHLKFADPEVKQPVRCLSGGVTALARGLWGLGRTREEKVRLADDLHHALDAAVIATLTPGRIKFITEYSKAKETGRVTEITDRETGEVYEVFRDKPFEFPRPWKGFRKEVLARLSENPEEAIGQLELDSYKDVKGLRPVLVSRMPIRKASGAIHADTIRSVRQVKDEGVSVVRCRLTDLTKASLSSLFDPEHNEKLYAAIRERMAPFGNDKNAGQKAFGDPANPLRKPTNDGSPGPVVRSVKVCKTQNAGVMVRKGVAENANIVRTDVYRKPKRNAWVYQAVPVYLWDLENHCVPTLPGERIFSLFPFDFVRVTTDDQDFFGYYRTFDRDDRGSGRLSISWPNRQKRDSKEKFPRFSMGKIRLIEKYEMGVLGDYYRVDKEVRRGLANRGDLEPGEAEDRE